jgi:AbrB family looped-hinge helix DNA binding protein
MNAQTKISSKGQVVIPKDVRERLHWAEGMSLDIVERPDGVLLKGPRRPNPFPRTTIEDILAIPRWPGPPLPIEQISRLDADALNRIFDEQDRRARD